MVTLSTISGALQRKKSDGGSPSLCKMFFHTDDGYCNIDKGRPGSSGMLPGFKGVLPLLDQYCPKEE